MDQGGPQRAPPFAARVFRWRSLTGTLGDPIVSNPLAAQKPPELGWAEFCREMIGWGYTLSELMAEDAYGLFQLRELLDPNCGRVED